MSAVNAQIGELDSDGIFSVITSYYFIYLVILLYYIYYIFYLFSYYLLLLTTKIKIAKYSRNTLNHETAKISRPTVP